MVNKSCIQNKYITNEQVGIGECIVDTHEVTGERTRLRILYWFTAEYYAIGIDNVSIVYSFLETVWTCFFPLASLQNWHTSATLSYRLILKGKIM